MSQKIQESAVLAGVESSAVSVLIRAVEHDENGRLPAALACYQEGIQLFIDIIKQTNDKVKQEQLRRKASEYMDRAEKIKDQIQRQKDNGTYHEQIQIPDNGTGFSYENIFLKYLDKSILKVEVEDPYVRNTHQTYNFLRFCELLVKSCCELKCIILITGSDEHDSDSQQKRFHQISKSLNEYKVELLVKYSPTLHDREIRLDNGWIIKIGRGLDYFKPTANKFSIGFCDQSLRLCHKTTVDIFFKK